MYAVPCKLSLNLAGIDDFRSIHRIRRRRLSIEISGSGSRGITSVESVDECLLQRLGNACRVVLVRVQSTVERYVSGSFGFHSWRKPRDLPGVLSVGRVIFPSSVFWVYSDWLRLNWELPIVPQSNVGIKCRSKTITIQVWPFRYLHYNTPTYLTYTARQMDSWGGCRSSSGLGDTYLQLQFLPFYQCIEVSTHLAWAGLPFTRERNMELMKEGLKVLVQYL